MVMVESLAPMNWPSVSKVRTPVPTRRSRATVSSLSAKKRQVVPELLVPSRTMFEGDGEGCAEAVVDDEGGLRGLADGGVVEVVGGEVEGGDGRGGVGVDDEVGALEVDGVAGAEVALEAEFAGGGDGDAAAERGIDAEEVLVEVEQVLDGGAGGVGGGGPRWEDLEGLVA
ncbi:hypothetical protein Pan265_20400 [Mucisphaera calidilacus]|uniref:Uncharacterized protein n=2 Tax=Mucisphaera calidilacus TaxID=2527982 RepID=A0A518BYX3_9BACT|nr:hypothetical protein Pan265_20400 [Mucisphaera calidilacus]